MWTNQTQKARVYSHDGPIRRRKHGYIITTDRSVHVHVTHQSVGDRLVAAAEQERLHHLHVALLRRD
eukprot:7888890-Pyramimonas_sp.AAC.1